LGDLIEEHLTSEINRLCCQLDTVTTSPTRRRQILDQIYLLVEKREKIRKAFEVKKHEHDVPSYKPDDR
jgi:hypothetical protein